MSVVTARRGRMVPHEVMQEALHALSQPLTAISLALTVAGADIEPDERQHTLLVAQEQCRRAMESLDQVRMLVNVEWTRGESVSNAAAIKLARGVA